MASTFLFVTCVFLSIYAISAALAETGDYATPGCLDCGFGMCRDMQRQVCDEAQNRCVCPPPRTGAQDADQRAKRDATAQSSSPKPAGSGCYDCGYFICNDGVRMHCDTERDECACAPGASPM